MKNFIKPLLISFSLSLFIPYMSSAEIPSVEDIQALESLKTGRDVVKDVEYKEIQTSTSKQDICGDCIFGYSFFNTTPTTFALSSNVPLPTDYILGPGDKILVEYFGNNSNKKEGYISRDGKFNLPLLGPASLAGMKFTKAEELIKNRVKQELIGTDVYLSLSEMRSINVYVVGAAYKPGTYTVSSLASLTNTILASGGPNQDGSLRNIQVKRNGLVVTNYDFYDLILQGDTSKDVRLQEGDTVFFPLIRDKIRLNGEVQRAGFFEIKKGETLGDILSHAGLRNDLDMKIEFSRYDKDERTRIVKMFKDVDEYEDLVLLNQDSLNIISSVNIMPSNILLRGEFNYPGYYDISSSETILDIINRAGGLTKQAYPEASVFTRVQVAEQQKLAALKNADNLEKSLIDAISSGSEIEADAYFAISQFIDKLREDEPIGRQVVAVDSYSLRTDPKYNFMLHNGDVLYVPKRSSYISVVGEVLNSTSHIFDEDFTVNDYISLSGGTTDGADLTKIFIVKPNGQAILYKNRLFQGDVSSSLLPGSTIVISRNPDPFNWLRLTTIITPILSDLAVSAAAISAINN